MGWLCLALLVILPLVVIGESCPWANWQKWSKCDCKTGLKTRIRNPSRLPKDCELKGCSKQFKRCKRVRCPIDCIYTSWSSWSECTGDMCGQGTRTRTRQVRVPALYGGKRCRFFAQNEPCQVIDNTCPANCGEWENWSDCVPIEECGDCNDGQAVQVIGYQVRRRYTHVPIPVDNCPMEESRKCNVPCCIDVGAYKK